MELSEYQIEENYNKLVTNLKPQWGNNKHKDIAIIGKEIIHLQSILAKATSRSTQARLKNEITSKMKIALGWGK